MAGVHWYNLQGGLRLDIPEWRLEEGQLPELTNFAYGDDHVLQVRRGLQRAIESSRGSLPIDGVHRASVAGKEPHTLVVAGGSVYRVLDSDPKWDSVESGMFAGAPYRFDAFMERIYIANGADYLHSWDGDDVGPVTGTRIEVLDPGVEPDDDDEGGVEPIEVEIREGPPAGGRFVQHFADRLFVGSFPGEPDTLYYSDLLDPEAWTDRESGLDNMIDVSPGDDQRITGMVRTRDQLTIFKSNSTYYLRGYDPEEWILQRVSDGIGCVAPGSIVEMDGRTLWLSNRGVYIDDGESFFRIGSAIQPFVDKLRRDQQEKAVATKAGWHYYIFFPDTPDGPVAFVYNVRLEAWARWNLAVPIGAVAEAKLPTDDSGWIAGDADRGVIYWGERGGTDDGTPIEASLRLPEIGTMEPQSEFDIRRLAVDGAVPDDDEAFIQVVADGRQFLTRDFSGDGRHVFSMPPRIGQKIRLSVHMKVREEGARVRGFAADIRTRRRVWR